ncbi:hypothetical protein E2542_SST27716 [Spatholobus suberectus]|nr:hypothetical protein E2542_SST27716 [Spatholobus suberectus]
MAHFLVNRIVDSAIQVITRCCFISTNGAESVKLSSKINSSRFTRPEPLRIASVTYSTEIPKN